MSDTIEARPDMIGGVPTPPLAVLPRPERLFRMRAERFEFLAQTATLAPYLTFLAALCRVQARLAAALPAVAPVDSVVVDPITASGKLPAGSCNLADMRAANPGVKFYAYLDIGGMSNASPALHSSSWSSSTTGLLTRDHHLTVPLDRSGQGDSAPDGTETITVYAREISAVGIDPVSRPPLVFLQGGPGCEAPRPSADSGLGDRRAHV